MTNHTASLRHTESKFTPIFNSNLNRNHFRLLVSMLALVLWMSMAVVAVLEMLFSLWSRLDMHFVIRLEYIRCQLCIKIKTLIYWLRIVLIYLLVFMPCQIADIFFRWVIAVWILYAHRTNGSVRNLCGWHCEFDKAMFGQFFRNLIVTSQSHSDNHLMRGVCP